MRAWRDVDLASVRLADGSDGFKRSWIMLMPEGEFDHPQYGKLEFSRKKLEEFKSNFDSRVRHIDIALDQDHDGGKATGWLEKLAIRDGGLYGLVRWTPLGEQLLRDQIYRYFSPEFGKFTDPQNGKVFNNVIIGGALTNRPFLKNMDAVQLKARFERPGQYTKGDRTKIPAEDFAGPNRTFPIVTQQDVHDAARLIGHAANPAAVKARIMAIARRKGFSLPVAWSNESGAASASEGARPVTARKRSTTLAEEQPAADEQEEFAAHEDDADELDEGEDFADEDDEAGELSEEEDGEESQSFADAAPAKKPAFKGAAKPFGNGGKKQQPAADAEDEADGGVDEGEELDDMTPDDEMEYDDASAEEAPAPKGRGKGKGKMPPTKKMTEPQLLAENRQLREEAKRLREEVFKFSISKKLSEFTKGIRTDGDDDEFALPRSFRLAYQNYMLSEGIRLSESARDGVDELVKLALRVGTVPLVSLANQIKRGDVDDNDDRRPRTSSERTVDRTDDAEKIALSEFKMPLSELARKYPDKAESIYLRLESLSARRGKPAA